MIAFTVRVKTATTETQRHRGFTEGGHNGIWFGLGVFSAPLCLMVAWCGK